MLTTPNFSFPYPEDPDAPDGPAQLQALAEATDDALTAILSVWKPVCEVDQIIPSGTATGLYIAGAIKRASTSAQSNTLPVVTPVSVPGDIATADMAGIAGHHLRKADENVIPGFLPIYRFVGSWENPDTAVLSGLTRVRIVILKPPHNGYAGMLQTDPLTQPTTNSSGLPVEPIESNGTWDPVTTAAADDFYPFGFEVSNAATNARTGFSAQLQRCYLPA
jgi:hypothetical protein